MATYPAAVKSFTSKTDNVDTVLAADVNTAYDEITALENAVGVNPAVTTSTLTGWDGTASKNWSTVGARLDNIERGVLADAHGSIYVHQAGGDTIQSSGSVVPLTLRGGTGNLFVVKDSGGTNKVVVDTSGNVTVAGTLGVTGGFSGTLSASAISVTNATVSGTLTGNNATVSGTLTATALSVGNAAISGTLNATTLQQSGHQLPFHMACSITNITVASGGTNAANNITLSGFTLPPIITATVNSASGNAIQSTLLVYNVTSAGFTIGIYMHAALSTTVTFAVFWHAIQGTSGTSSLS